jgi:hypothetical protein
LRLVTGRFHVAYLRETAELADHLFVVDVEFQDGSEQKKWLTLGRERAKK